VTLRVLLESCGEDLFGLRDAALLSLAYDGGLRVSGGGAQCQRLTERERWQRAGRDRAFQN
jgi:site-specific recombinase XerC